jgi:hypothetical protein
VDAYYEILRQAKKKAMKYMGRAVLKDLILLSHGHPIISLHSKIFQTVDLTLE